MAQGGSGLKVRILLKKWVYALAFFGATNIVSFADDPFGMELSRERGEGQLYVTLRVTIPPKFHIYADQLQIESESGISFKSIGGDQPVLLKDSFSDEAQLSYTNDIVIQFRSTSEVASNEPLKVSYQGCNEKQCFFPKTRFFAASLPSGPVAGVETGVGHEELHPAAAWHASLSGLHVAASASGYVNSKDFISFLNRVEGREGKEPPPEGIMARIKAASLLFSANPLEFFKIFGVFWTVLIILVGGFLLNLTPCVLPMIPVNLAIIGVGAQNGSKLRGFLLGGAYGLGIALVYGMVGLVVVLTGAQFGVLNSLPWFNMTIGVVFVLLALAMFDVFAIDMSRFQRMGSGPNQGKIVTAMLMGGVAALLAGACVAPVVIAVLLLSSNLYAQGASIGLALPFILGAGMALPWPLAGSGLSFLPKPGVWMTWVKGGFGILIFLLAVYYFALAYQGWWGKKTILKAEPGVIQITVGDVSAWQAVAAESFKTGKPVFIDFWASWCKNCEAMELTTFRSQEVKQRLSQYVVVKYQAENLTDKGTRGVVDYFGVRGLPTYVVLKPGGTSP